VAEEARGNGLAKQLMVGLCDSCASSRSQGIHTPAHMTTTTAQAHVCCGAAQPRHIRQLLTTTIPQNTAALRVLTGLGFAHSHTVDRWPQESRQFAYESAVGFKPNTNPEQPVLSAPGQLHMLDHLPGWFGVVWRGVRCAGPEAVGLDLARWGCYPTLTLAPSCVATAAGARQLIAQMTAAQGVQPGDWVCCSSVQQLQEAVASIRSQQQQQQTGHGGGGACQGGEWLPWVYEVYPLQSHWVAERIAARQVWLLPSPPGSSQGCSSSYAAVVVCAHSSLNFRTSAGVLAVDEAAMAAAFDWVGSRCCHFVAYVDRGRPHSSDAPDPHLVLPPVLQLGSQGQQRGAEAAYMCYLVLGREADGVGGDGGGGLPKL
jgi:hypothetical protein